MGLFFMGSRLEQEPFDIHSVVDQVAETAWEYTSVQFVRDLFNRPSEIGPRLYLFLPKYTQESENSRGRLQRTKFILEQIFFQIPGQEALLIQRGDIKRGNTVIALINPERLELDILHFSRVGKQRQTLPLDNPNTRLVITYSNLKTHTPFSIQPIEEASLHSKLI